VGHTTLKVTSSQVAKYDKMVSDNEHAFISFTFDTIDFLALETNGLRKRIQMIMYSNVMSMNLVFMMIDFTIQKRVSGAVCCSSDFYSSIIHCEYHYKLNLSNLDYKLI